MVCCFQSTSRKDEYEYIIRDATQVDDVMGATSIYEDEDDLPSLDDVLRHDTRPDVVQQVHYVNSSAPKVKANGYSLLPTSDLWHFLTSYRAYRMMYVTCLHVLLN